MSTYQGEKFIKEQIQCILEQENVDVHLTIRDDGSTDNTVEKIKELQRVNEGKISLILGKNIGYVDSFLSALLKAENADYYAFSDQDDYWKKEKLYTAIKQLNESKAILYASGVTITDKELHPVGHSDTNSMINTAQCYFARMRLPGCTFVFTKKLKDKVNTVYQVNRQEFHYRIPGHDSLVAGLAFCLGKVFIDNHNYIYHRRSENSVTSGGNGLGKRLHTEMRVIFHHKCYRSNVAKLIANSCGDEIKDSETRHFINTISTYRKNIGNRLKLVGYPGFSSGNKIIDLESKFCVLIGTY